MRQSLPFRLLGSLLVPLYAMGTWIAPTLEVCPMHGSPRAAPVAAQTISEHPGHDAEAAQSQLASENSAQGAAASSESALRESAPVESAQRQSASSWSASNASALAESPAAPVVMSAATMTSPMVMATDAPANTHSHGCDCLRCCAGSNGPAIPGSEFAIATPAEKSTDRIEIQKAEVVVVRLAHVLPFATAPPSTLV